jgi:alginate O-acetyltransferase complex protein AlgI
MLFTTTTFALIYLPLVLAGYFVLGRASATAAAAWLLLASLFFYGWWMPEFTALLVLSIAVNFCIGLRILQARADDPSERRARRWLAAGVVFNLGLLGYFKYANFFVANFNAALGGHWDIVQVVLPIGISFYTFTQIAYLVDTRQGKVGETRWLHYGLFVTYFPHLVAGPVLHHAQMMPQFADPKVYRLRAAHLAAGLMIFAIGLTKKIVFADGIAPYADAVFGPADRGLLPDTEEAWLAALAYTLQLYFDFSGYSDMAIGLSWMFNIRLPFNFDSPYRAANISEFWRRWHISLSTFLRDYLYVPLGGNRRGPLRRYGNLAATMLLGGLWHGAGWTFVFWGGLHGMYLMLHHGLRALIDGGRIPALARLRGAAFVTVLSWALTMLAVVVAWVFFRAETFAGASRIVAAMAALPPTGGVHVLMHNAGLQANVGWGWVLVLAAVALWPFNSNRIGTALLEALRERRFVPAGAVAGAALAGMVLLVVMNTARDGASAFIYFNF